MLSLHAAARLFHAAYGSAAALASRQRDFHAIYAIDSKDRESLLPFTARVPGPFYCSQFYRAIRFESLDLDRGNEQAANVMYELPSFTSLASYLSFTEG